MQMNQEQNRPDTTKMPLIFWALWAAAIISTAAYTWWSSVGAEAPLDMAQLVLRCTIVGLVGLIVITRIEARVAPWRFFK
jgi:hypothetical protein